MRRSIALATWLVLGCSAGAGAPPASQRAERGVCDDFELDVERVWNASAKGDIRSGLGSLQASYTQHTAEVVITKLDAVARDWVMLKRNACLDTVVRKVMPRETYVALGACYDAALSRQRMLVSVLGKADGEVAAKSLELVEETSQSLTACGNRAVLAS